MNADKVIGHKDLLRTVIIGIAIFGDVFTNQNIVRGSGIASPRTGKYLPKQL